MILIDKLGFKEMFDKLVKANRVRLHGHVLRRQKDDVLRKALRMRGSLGPWKGILFYNSANHIYLINSLVILKTPG